MRIFLFMLLLLPVCAVAIPPISQTDSAAGSPAAGDADFLAAREAFRIGDAARFEAAAARLKTSPLEPYLAYYRLRMNLETADAAAVQAFLARPDDTPMIDRLRGDWLKLLGRRQQWDAFLAEYPRLVNGDTELACYAMQARLGSDPAAAQNDARNLWLSSNQGLPESCSPVFEAALAAGTISAADVWQRVRLALEAVNVPLASQLSARLPPERALPLNDLSLAAANPDRYLGRLDSDKAGLKNASEGRRMVTLFALNRLARRNPQQAWVEWKKIEANFTPDEQRYFYAWQGYHAARHLDARALEWFRAAGDAPLDEQQLAWRARAALRALNWREVLNSIGKMKPQQQQENAWRYWRARAEKALGQEDRATLGFQALRSEQDFYGLLAAEETGGAGAHFSAHPYRPGAAELAAMQARPAVQRTLALYRMNLRPEAQKEWSWMVRRFDDKQLLTAAEVARRNAMYDRAINTAELTTQLHDFNLRYLSPYRDILREYIHRNDLDEAWVYGLMRQESRFVVQAKSNVGATGIMQVMPATAKWIARKLGIRYSRPMVQDVDTNLMLGTYYMKTVLDWFDGNPALASAAYNAGPGRARQWRGDIPLEGAIYAETIPLDETRGYVKKVLSNTMYYAELFGQPQYSLKQRLGVIAARTPENQKPIPDEH